MCPHPAHRPRRGRRHCSTVAQRNTRRRADPHGRNLPGQSGQPTSPANNTRSTSSGSIPTMITSASGRPKDPPVTVQVNQREGSCATSLTPIAKRPEQPSPPNLTPTTPTILNEPGALQAVRGGDLNRTITPRRRRTPASPQQRRHRRAHRCRCRYKQLVDVAIVVDLIHVVEYLWGAVWCFFAEGDPAAQAWVHDRALAVLSANARKVAAGIRRRASTARLNNQKRLRPTPAPST